MRAWADVAVLAKTRGIEGRFVARAAAGLPFLVEEGMEVAFVPPRLDVPRRAVVADVRPIDGRSADIAFEGVGAEASSALVGAHCLVPRSALDDDALQEAPAFWEGWTVVDACAGEIGEVVGFVDNSGQSLLEVSREDGGTVLVPVVDEIVVDVDVSDGIVRVDLPSGLLEL